MAKLNHTPSPWWWQSSNGTSKLMGKRHFLVMDCVRHGMNSAVLRFAIRKDSMGGLMYKETELDINAHPDARLIAAAPDLYAACVTALENGGLPEGTEAIIRAAVERAEKD